MKKNRLGRHTLLLLLAAICLIYTSSIALGASIQWTTENGKETLRILLATNDGFAGKPQRIDTNGILIPFSEVPPNMLIQETPAGAKLVDSTLQLGTALAVKTQTPEFGFVVVKQTPRELVIDFFPDPLGARWKPTPKGNTPGATATEALQPTPSGSQAEATPQNNLVQDTTSSQTPKQSTAQQPQTVAPNAEQPLQQQAQQVPVTQQIPAGQPTQQSIEEVQAPNTTTPTALQSSAPAAAQTTNGTQPAVAKQNQETTVSSQPPVATQQSPASPKAEIDVQPVAPAVPQNQAQNPELQSTPAPASTAKGAATPFSPNQPQAQTAAPQPTNTFYGMEDEDLPVGRGVNAGPGNLFRGRINMGGAENIETLPVIPEDQQQPPKTNPLPKSEGAPAERLQQPIQNTAESTVESPAVPTTQPENIPNNANPQANTQSSGASQTTETTPENTSESQPTVELNTEKTSPMAPPSDSLEAKTPPTVTDSKEPLPASTEQPKEPAKSTPEKSETATAAPAENVIYVDEEGKPVDPPLNPSEALPEAVTMLAKAQFEEGLAIVDKLLSQSDLTFEQREEALHLRSEFLFNLHKDNLAENFQLISDATKQAYNFNQSSLRNADALLRLGYINLKVGNIPEAEAQFNILRKLFPEHENIPLTYYYWGEYYYDQGELAKAADQFQYILQKFPDSRFAKDASLGLGRAYYQMGYYKEAFDIVDYMSKRWPGFYLDYPLFLNMIGDSAFRLGKLDNALDNYWLYANLEPNSDDTAMVLTRIGDIYSTLRQQSAAAVVYRLAAERFPDKDGGLIAKMRLAEASVQDTPSILDMFNVFDASFDTSPKEIYTSIIQDHPDSPIAPLAMLKLAMWHLWQKEYLNALDTTTEFMKKFPEHPLASKAKEVAMEAYAILAALSAQKGNYDQMRDVWEKYPIVREQMDHMSPESRMSLAYSYWKANQPDAALKSISNFFIGPKVPVYSESALNLALSIYLEHDQWLGIREVANRVSLWELTPSAKQNLDYALALAAENLDESDVAAPLWEKLYLSETLTEAQKAYAAYFLSREAERNNELERSYLIGLDALTRLSDLVQKDPEQLDLEKLKTQVALLMRVAERAGRLNEALQYSQRYLEYLDSNDPERAAVLYRVARIYKTQGDDESWRQGLEDIISQYPNSVYGQTAASELKSADLQKNVGGYSPSGGI